MALSLLARDLAQMWFLAEEWGKNTKTIVPGKVEEGLGESAGS